MGVAILNPPLPLSCPPLPHTSPTLPHTFAMTSSEGLPIRSVISSNWCTTFLPGKRGRPRSTCRGGEGQGHKRGEGEGGDTRVAVTSSGR